MRSKASTCIEYRLTRMHAGGCVCCHEKGHLAVAFMFQISASIAGIASRDFVSAMPRLAVRRQTNTIT